MRPYEAASPNEVEAGRAMADRESIKVTVTMSGNPAVGACSGGRSRLDLEYDDAIGGCERGSRRGVERFEVEVVALGDGPKRFADAHLGVEHRPCFELLMSSRSTIAA